jgi:hypothetical protein
METWLQTSCGISTVIPHRLNLVRPTGNFT